MKAPRALAALAALFAAAPAEAYRRSADATTGKELFWALPVVPYGVNAARPATSPGAPSCAPGGADPALAAVRASFSAWNRDCSNLELLYAGTVGEIRTGMHGTQDDLVVFRRGWCSNNTQALGDPCWTDPASDCANLYNCFEDQSPSQQAIVAFTSVLYEPDTGRIVGADIEVNGWDGQLPGTAFGSPPSHGWYFTCTTSGGTCQRYDEAGCIYMDLQNTVTHEVGHLVGLDHTGISSTTMYEYTWPGDLAKRTLSPDDVAGVCAIYPRPSGGCATAGGAGAASLALAAAAWRRRRRAA